MDRHCGHCGAALDRTEVVGAVALDTCADTLHPVAAGWRLWVVPLQHRGCTLGVYNLFFAAGAAPAPHVQGLLRSVGELLGLALHNARLEAENLRASLAAERQAMAAELHDSVAQALTFVKMRLPLLRDALVAHDDERSLAYFDDVRSTVGEAHAALRGLLTHYRSVGDPLGLDHALAASASAFRRQSDAELVVDNRLPALRLSADQELQVCRIVQEALANVARHAAARHARLQLGAAGAEEVEVVVEDDGAGLAARQDAEGGHHGLAIMSERARRIGGRLEVIPREGGGTRVRLTFPAVPQGVA